MRARRLVAHSCSCARCSIIPLAARQKTIQIAAQIIDSDRRHTRHGSVRRRPRRHRPRRHCNGRGHDRLIGTVGAAPLSWRRRIALRLKLRLKRCVLCDQSGDSVLLELMCRMKRLHLFAQIRVLALQSRLLIPTIVTVVPSCIRPVAGRLAGVRLEQLLKYLQVAHTIRKNACIFATGLHAPSFASL